MAAGRVAAKTRQRTDDIKRLFAEGKSRDQVAADLNIKRAGLASFLKRNKVKIPEWADRRSGVASAGSINAMRIISGSVDALSGIAQGLKLIDGKEIEIDSDVAAHLLSDAREALRVINAMVAALKEAAK